MYFQATRLTSKQHDFSSFTMQYRRNINNSSGIENVEGRLVQGTWFRKFVRPGPHALGRKNSKTKVSLWSKTHQMFSAHTTQEEFKNEPAVITGPLRKADLNIVTIHCRSVEEVFKTFSDENTV